MKVLHSICQQIWKKVRSSHKTGKGQFSFQSQRRTMPKNVQSTVQVCSFYMLARLYAKSFKLGFSSTWTDVPARFRKGRETRDQIHWVCGTRDNIHWIMEKVREFQKNIYFCLFDYAKAFDCVDHKTVENSSRYWNNRLPYMRHEKSISRSRNNN